MSPLQLLIFFVALPPLLLLSGVQASPTTSKDNLPLSSTCSTPNSDPVLEKHRQEVITMAAEAWRSIGSSVRGNLPQAIASLGTLWLMDLRVEFDDARHLLDIESGLYGRKKVVRQLAESEESLGALLSAYALSGDEQLLGWAKEVAALYEAPALSEDNLLRIAYTWMNHKLESRFLENPKLAKSVEKTEKYLHSIDPLQTIQDTDTVTLSVELKSYLQSGRKETPTFSSYLQRVADLQSSGYLHSSSRFSTLAQVRHEHLGTMNVWHCLLAATLALGVPPKNSKEPSFQTTSKDHHLKLAQAIAETCHLATNSTASGLPYALFGIEETSNSQTSIVKGVGGYALEPSLAEAYFVLHRTLSSTKGENRGTPQKYQQYAWELASAIRRYSRVNETEGYSATMDSDQLPPVPTTPLRQPPHFISGTLKYLYLTLAPADCLPLDRWVFNVAGHPLPICANAGGGADKGTFGCSGGGV